MDSIKAAVHFESDSTDLPGLASKDVLISSTADETAIPIHHATRDPSSASRTSALPRTVTGAGMPASGEGFWNRAYRFWRVLCCVMTGALGAPLHWRQYRALSERAAGSLYQPPCSC